jgi:hypothetical protein
MTDREGWLGRIASQLRHDFERRFRPGRTERGAAAKASSWPAAASDDPPAMANGFIGAVEQHTEEGPRVMIVGRVRLLTPGQAKRLASELWIAADRMGG